MDASAQRLSDRVGTTGAGQPRHGLCRPRQPLQQPDHHSGRVPSPSTLRTWLEQRIAAAGVTPLPLHSTRRTFGTLALEAGTPLKEVSEALGHASVAVTAKAYSHIVNQRQRRAATAMGAVLAPKTAPGAKIGSRKRG